MITPDDVRTVARKRKVGRPKYGKRTVIWSEDGTRVIAVVEGDHHDDPDTIAAARALAYGGTPASGQ
ncbi:hypothetical protein ACIBH1_45425 [Nonomuraea sp. NPDC050663]|uniref:hypothetical protein n=1 Tax=Nonomuraea sp. NPDC050663 TaxID=3364370 RepID=UPI0037B56526